MDTTKGTTSITDFKDAHPTLRGAIEAAWNWFGNHGVFIGGTAFIPAESHRMVHPNCTPFEYLAFARENVFGGISIAIRLRHGVHKTSRLADSMECFLYNDSTDGKNTDVTIFSFSGNPDDVDWPEPCRTISEHEFETETPLGLVRLV